MGGSVGGGGGRGGRDQQSQLERNVEKLLGADLIQHVLYDEGEDDEDEASDL